MSETAEDFKVGDLVRVTSAARYSRISEYGADHLTPQIELEVRRVLAKSLRVMRTYNGGMTASYWIPRTELALIHVDPNAPKPRQLGEVPEGGISPDDPRLAWLWEDAAKVASASFYCDEYDKIADKLGIPERVRTFKVSRTVNDLTVSGSFSARSKKEADAMFEEKLATTAAVEAGLTA